MKKLRELHNYSVLVQKDRKWLRKHDFLPVSIYWVRKRNRKERLSREGWVLDSSSVHFYLDFFWYRKDGNRLGYVATSPSSMGG